MKSQLNLTSGEQLCTVQSNRLRWIAEEMLETARRLQCGGFGDFAGRQDCRDVVPFIDNCYRMALEAAAAWLLPKRNVVPSSGMCGSLGSKGLGDKVGGSDSRSRDMLLFYLEICGLEVSDGVRSCYIDGIKCRTAEDAGLTGSGSNAGMSLGEQCMILDKFIRVVLSFSD